MDLEYDIYNYDKCQFYSLLELPKFRSKYNLVKEQQGIIVCPLELAKQSNNLANQSDLIDRHLFIPSPFYKNQYIPLLSLTFPNTSTINNNMSNYNNSNFNSNINTEFLNASYSICLNPVVYLILNEIDDGDEDKRNEFYLMKHNKQICKDVKRLGIEIGYTESNKQYKILIVNKELMFKVSNINRNKSIRQKSYQPTQTELGSTNSLRTINFDDEDEHEDNLTSNKTDDNQAFNSNFPNYDSSRRRVSNISSLSINLNDVTSFGQSIDFMHNTTFLVDEFQFNRAKNQVNSSRSSSVVNDRQFRLKSCIIGEYLLNELELFKKTYIILPNYLEDCANNLNRIYDKYVKLFLESFILDGRKLAQAIQDADLIITIACENTIVGCLYTKLWPCILAYNHENDELLKEKCKQLKAKLKLENKDDDDLNNQNESKIAVWAEYLHLDKAYFKINFKPILKEIRKLSMLNNPFECMKCIKTSIDLLTNELTISVIKQKQLIKSEMMASIKLESFQITSETLLPLLAFILIKSEIECFKSIISFIDMFNFSSKPNDYSNSDNSILISELNYFMTSFRAAIQIIENLA